MLPARPCNWVIFMRKEIKGPSPSLLLANVSTWATMNIKIRSTSEQNQASHDAKENNSQGQTIKGIVLPGVDLFCYQYSLLLFCFSCVAHLYFPSKRSIEKKAPAKKQ